MEQSYDVLKFVTDGRRTHIGVDCVQGILLAQWVREDASQGVSSGVLSARFKELADMLAAYHRCQISDSYQYLSPYSVVTEPGRNGKWHLVDSRSINNQELMKLARRREVRTAFLPARNQLYQGMDEQADVYSFGRLMQFVFCKVGPDMKRREEKELQKIILWCLEPAKAGTSWRQWVQQFLGGVGQKKGLEKTKSFQEASETLRRLERKQGAHGRDRRKWKK